MTRRTRTPTPSTHQGGISRHGARIFDAIDHDPYRPRYRYAEPTRCERCGAVFKHGRWTWEPGPTEASTVVCPACARVRDGLPAGTLVVEGAYARAHRDELLRLVRHQAELERAEHPQNRIMAIDEGPERVVVTTTDIHLPRRIGEALERAHDGALTLRFREDDYGVRVLWQR